jgi:hypothetical protein
LDYDNILFRKAQFLPIVFDGDVLFELPPIHSNAHNPSQMQGMDKSTMTMLGVNWSQPIFYFFWV